MGFSASRRGCWNLATGEPFCRTARCHIVVDANCLITMANRLKHHVMSLRTFGLGWAASHPERENSSPTEEQPTSMLCIRQRTHEECRCLSVGCPLDTAWQDLRIPKASNVAQARDRSRRAARTARVSKTRAVGFPRVGTRCPLELAHPTPPDDQLLEITSPCYT